VEVDAYGNTLTLVIARKDSALVAKIHSPLKEGGLITYKSTTDEKGTIWLNSVTIKPKDATLPPEPSKEDTSDDKKPDDKKTGDK
jgi:hypothetical protein